MENEDENSTEPPSVPQSNIGLDVIFLHTFVREEELPIVGGRTKTELACSEIAKKAREAFKEARTSFEAAQMNQMGNMAGVQSRDEDLVCCPLTQRRSTKKHLSSAERYRIRLNNNRRSTHASLIEKRIFNRARSAHIFQLEQKQKALITAQQKVAHRVSELRRMFVARNDEIHKTNVKHSKPSTETTHSSRGDALYTLGEKGTEERSVAAGTTDATSQNGELSKNDEQSLNLTASTFHPHPFVPSSCSKRFAMAIKNLLCE